LKHSLPSLYKVAADERGKEWISTHAKSPRFETPRNVVTPFHFEASGRNKQIRFHNQSKVSSCRF
jgi:hypothetical protein